MRYKKAGEEMRKELMSRINDEFYDGVMSYSKYRLIDKCIEEYAFEPQVVFALFADAYFDGYINSDEDLNNVAALWRIKGLCSKERFDSYYQLLFPQNDRTDIKI